MGKGNQSTPARPNPAMLAVLVFLVLVSTCMVFFWGASLAPAQEQLWMVAASLFAALILFFGSTAVFEGKLAGMKIRLTGFFGAFAAFYLLFYRFAPQPHVQTVTVQIELEGKLLAKDFTLRAIIPGIDPITQRGEQGVAQIHVARHVTAIDNLTLTCLGFELNADRPYPIIDGVLRLAVKRGEDPPPLLPQEYPSADAIPDLPTREMVEAPPRFNPKEVSFRYKNATGVDLRLLLFSCSKFYNMEKAGFVPKSPWSDYDFPSRDVFATADDFQYGTGWFCLFVKTKASRDGDTTAFYLGRRNICDARVTSLVVEATGESQHPFRATFESED